MHSINIHFFVKEIIRVLAICKISIKSFGNRRLSRGAKKCKITCCGLELVGAEHVSGAKILGRWKISLVAPTISFSL